MVLKDLGDIEEALNRVGELLAAAGHEYAIVVLGGAALGLLGIVNRETRDVDILTFAEPRRTRTMATVRSTLGWTNTP